jgi:hypothetical protein
MEPNQSLTKTDIQELSIDGLHPNSLLLQNQLAKILHKSVRSLERDRVQGSGPKFCKAGKRVLYRWSDVLKFLEDNSFSSTSEAKIQGAS